MIRKKLPNKKKVEIRCQRCNGPMAFEKFFGPNDSFFGWHCLICGDILDPVILLHRLSQDAHLAIPEKEEERISLIKKYMNPNASPLGSSPALLSGPGGQDGSRRQHRPGYGLKS